MSTKHPMVLMNWKLLSSLLFVNDFPFVSDDESGEKAVSVLLAGEESELIFIDFSTSDISVSTISHWNIIVQFTHIPSLSETALCFS